LQGVNAVLFDLDGTLVDSSKAIINAVEKVLELKGLTCDRAKVARMMEYLSKIFLVFSSQTFHRRRYGNLSMNIGNTT
jgi:beta-phosphoglucomutase-like phosphatase (HAD superfamily)